MAEHAAIDPNRRDSDDALCPFRGGPALSQGSETLLMRRDARIVTIVNATDVRPATRDGLAALRKEASP